MDEGAPPGENNHSAQRAVRIEITWASIFRVLLGIFLAAVLITVWRLIELLILAILVAVALYPIVRWIESKRLARWIGLTTASALLLATSIGFFAFLGPMLVKQTASAIENVPQLKEELLSHLPARGPLKRMATESIDTVAGAQPVVSKALDLGKTALIGIFEFGLIV